MRKERDDACDIIIGIFVVIIVFTINKGRTCTAGHKHTNNKCKCDQEKRISL